MIVDVFGLQGHRTKWYVETKRAFLQHYIVESIFEEQQPSKKHSAYFEYGCSYLLGYFIYFLNKCLN